VRAALIGTQLHPARGRHRHLDNANAQLRVPIPDVSPCGGVAREIASSTSPEPTACVIAARAMLVGNSASGAV